MAGCRLEADSAGTICFQPVLLCRAQRDARRLRSLRESVCNLSPAPLVLANKSPRQLRAAPSRSAIAQRQRAASRTARARASKTTMRAVRRLPPLTSLEPRACRLAITHRGSGSDDGSRSGSGSGGGGVGDELRARVSDLVRRSPRGVAGTRLCISIHATFVAFSPRRRYRQFRDASRSLPLTSAHRRATIKTYQLPAFCFFRRPPYAMQIPSASTTRSSSFFFVVFSTHTARAARGAQHSPLKNVRDGGALIVARSLSTARAECFTRLLKANAPRRRPALQRSRLVVVGRLVRSSAPSRIV